MGMRHSLLWRNGNSDGAIQTKIKTQDPSCISEPIFLEGVHETLALVMFPSIAYIAIGEYVIIKYV